jgi:hypothetical protein
MIAAYEETQFTIQRSIYLMCIRFEEDQLASYKKGVIL